MLRHLLKGSQCRTKTLSRIWSSGYSAAPVLLAKSVSYVQGQSPTPKTREYFYYIDHQGQLFLDDTKLKTFVTCFKDRQFLKFFFRRIKLNSTGRYEDFPYISPCGPEHNYIRCDDVPVVFATITESSGSTEGLAVDVLTYSGIGPSLTYPFQPTKVCMLPESGRIYHPGPQKAGGVGLIKSSLAIELGSHFEYEQGVEEKDPPTHFNWKGVRYELDNSLWEVLRSKEVEELKQRSLKK